MAQGKRAEVSAAQRTEIGRAVSCFDSTLTLSPIPWHSFPLTKRNKEPKHDKLTSTNCANARQPVSRFSTLLSLCEDPA
jgi:hypothetical protein